jgi:hypothetical protein
MIWAASLVGCSRGIMDIMVSSWVLWVCLRIRDGVETRGIDHFAGYAVAELLNLFSNVQ